MRAAAVLGDGDVVIRWRCRQTRRHRERCRAGKDALAWLLAKGDDIVPIPGTKRIKYLEENAAGTSITFSEAERTVLEQALFSLPVSGERYAAEGMRGVNA
ncbi:hypothetical protein [Paracoccus sp. S3-43]|uniref:hypothetical protein n=1 Tax=Paracoccus sp. S3-43 TaxID=3030011 RepID=UPI0023B011BF|nr:hypothetical protein [Paracoccus sp. S3-43]WEF25335.1 hypothetical protein PXD02_05180 [Paracoccus sp. S3-43]